MKSVWDEMREESLAEGMEKGMAKGMAKGKSEAQENFVLNMLKEGELALDKIAKYVGWPLAEIQKLAKSLA